MATKTVVTLVDDLTGEGGDDIGTVQFGLDRSTFEIDLDEANQATLREALAPYLAVARRTGGRSTRRTGQRTSTSTPRAAATVTTLPAQQRPRSRDESANIRDWARRNGIGVADRGRIPAEVLERYDAAHRGRQAG